MAKAAVVKSILMVLMRNRKDTAARVQGVFTDYGCVIRTRLGLHDGVGDSCTNTGLILLELAGEGRLHRELAGNLRRIKGVKTKLVTIGF